MSENTNVLPKNEVVSATVRAYFRERPHLIDAQPEAEVMWKNINGHGRINPLVEALYRKATKSKKALRRNAPKDLIALTGPKGQKVVVSAADVRKAVGAKSVGRLSHEQRAKAYEIFSA